MDTLNTPSRAGAAALLRHPKYELIPMKGVEKTFTSIPKGASVSITVSPTKGIEATLELTEQLAKTIPAAQITPHLSARLVEGHAPLESILNRVRNMGVQELFVVGGDSETPAGPFGNSLELIRAVREMDTDIRLGVTAYPEGHPSISKEVLQNDLLEKQAFVNFMATQLCFDAKTIQTWLQEVRQLGVTLPVQLGVAGAIDMVKLMQISSRIGVGDSLRYLSKHAGTVFKLMSGYKPDDLLRELEGAFADPAYGITGFHIYTFNNVERTEAWRQTWLGEA